MLFILSLLPGTAQNYPVCNPNDIVNVYGTKGVAPPITSSAVQQRVSSECTSEYVSQLSIEELIDWLKTTDYECQRFLYSFDENLVSVYTNENIQVVLDEIISIAPNYDGTNSLGIYGLLNFIHTAQFHDFYQPEVDFNDLTISKYLTACHAMIDNPHILDHNEEALNILYELVILIDLDNNRETFVNFVKILMLRINFAYVEALPLEPDTFYYRLTYNGIFFYMVRGVNNNDVAYKQVIENDIEFRNQLYSISVDLDLYAIPEYSFMVTNAIREYGRLGEIPGIRNEIIAGLAGYLTIYERLSEPWLIAVDFLNWYGECETYDVCKDTLIPEIEEKVFPNHFSYENSTIVFNTSISKERLILFITH